MFVRFEKWLCHTDVCLCSPMTDHSVIQTIKYDNDKDAIRCLFLESKFQQENIELLTENVKDSIIKMK